MENKLTCTDCALNGCKYADGDRPAFCPTDAVCGEERDRLLRRIAEPENWRVVEAAAVSVNTAYRGKLSRLEETIIFARELGAHLIGIAACVSLAAEARALARVLKAQGFDVVGTICKIGSVTHGDVGLEVEGCSSSMVLCNPIYQAKALNDARTDLNVVMGLCVGHDALFLKHADSLCTFLTTKDFKFDGYAVRALHPDDPSGEYERLASGHGGASLRE